MKSLEKAIILLVLSLFLCGVTFLLTASHCFRSRVGDQALVAIRDIVQLKEVLIALDTGDKRRSKEAIESMIASKKSVARTLHVALPERRKKIGSIAREHSIDLDTPSP